MENTQNLKERWVKLNNEYDILILNILDNKKVDLEKIKKMQKELFELEVEIFNIIKN